MARYTVVIPKHESASRTGGWCAKVAIDDVLYFVNVERGKRVRIPYKPRGKNVGFHWWGIVRNSEGKQIFCDRVSKSVGILGLLKSAGVLKSKETVDTGTVL